ncbi:MAG: hypothetical protein J07HR59_00778, partial [Halorubrum sp. J07HR59]
PTMLLQLVDSFLLDYHVGHVLLLLLVVTTLGAIPLGSQKVIAANLMTFGLIFTVSPFGIMTQLYILLGIALIVVAPLLWTTATE